MSVHICNIKHFVFCLVLNLRNTRYFEQFVTSFQQNSLGKFGFNVESLSTFIKSFSSIVNYLSPFQTFLFFGVIVWEYWLGLCETGFPNKTTLALPCARYHCRWFSFGYAFLCSIVVVARYLF